MDADVGVQKVVAVAFGLNRCLRAPIRRVQSAVGRRQLTVVYFFALRWPLRLREAARGRLIKEPVF